MKSRPGPPVVPEVSWFWNWVPAPDSDAQTVTDWTARVSALLDEWAGEKVDAARAEWPAEEPEEFPFAIGEMGQAVARSLLERAAGLPAYVRLFWGAAFVGGDLRWMPLLVTAEFREPRADDPAYLMAEVGADGLAGDVREPVIDYVATDRGDGLRVFALASSEEEGVYGRVDAALRLEVPATAAAPGTDVDVLLRTRVFGMDQMALIGFGVEALMHLIAADSVAAPTEDGAPLRFAAAPAGGSQS
jgi:hypothetical protein